MDHRVDWIWICKHKEFFYCRSDPVQMQSDVRWAPREINLEADRLANGNFQGFSIELRIRPLPQSPDWYILGEGAERRRHKTERVDENDRVRNR